jgi:hypothetical protein
MYADELELEEKIEFRDDQRSKTCHSVYSGFDLMLNSKSGEMDTEVSFC